MGRAEEGETEGGERERERGRWGERSRIDLAREFRWNHFFHVLLAKVSECCPASQKGQRLCLSVERVSKTSTTIF